jgi:uncharacterized protein YjbJ (UPF0337 family)
MKNQSYLSAEWIKVRRFFLSAIAGALTVTFIFLGVITDNSAAIAAPASELDLIAMTSSTAKKVEGKADQAIGTVQRKVGEMAESNTTKGVGKQVKGRAKEDIGRVQGALENTQDQVERKASKDINQTQSALDKATDAVKDLFNN